MATIITTYDELKSAFSSGGEYELGDDITVTGGLNTTRNGCTIYLKDHSLLGNGSLSSRNWGPLNIYGPGYIHCSISFDEHNTSHQSGSGKISGATLYNRVTAYYQSHCTIENCEIKGIAGTAVSVPSESTSITVTGCKFSNNSTCINVVLGSATVSDSTFTNSTDTAVKITNHEYVRGGFTATNCVFNNNKGTKGGAVYTYNYYSSSFTNCTFTNNSADYGGAIYTEQPTSGRSSWGGASLTDCVVTNNTASSGGGGYGQITFHGKCIVKDNTTTSGEPNNMVLTRYFLESDEYYSPGNPTGEVHIKSIARGSMSYGGYLFRGYAREDGYNCFYSDTTPVYTSYREASTNSARWGDYVPPRPETPPAYLKKNGQWVAGVPYIKVNGSWKPVSEAYIKVNGTWKKQV